MDRCQAANKMDTSQIDKTVFFLEKKMNERQVTLHWLEIFKEMKETKIHYQEKDHRKVNRINAGQAGPK